MYFMTIRSLFYHCPGRFPLKARGKDSIFVMIHSLKDIKMLISCFNFIGVMNMAGSKRDYVLHQSANLKFICNIMKRKFRSF